MCDKPISKKIEVKTDKTEQITASNLNLEYTGKTTGMKTTLKSRPKSTLEIMGNTQFQTVGDICDKTDYLESKAVLNFDHIMFGPLDTFGSKLTFDNMYFHFKNLKLNLIVMFYYNPLSICRESPVENGKKEYSIKYDIDKEAGIDLELFYATNGKTNDINSLFYDLQQDFKNYKSFYDYFIGQVDIYQFSKDIEEEFKKAYCETQSETTEEKAVRNSYICYKQKVEILKKLDVFQIIYSKI